jgi:putative thiamine transport system permease protein
MVLLFLVPLGLSIALILPLFADVEAFAAMVQHPQFKGSLLLTFFTGITSTLISLLLASTIVQSQHANMTRDAGLFLALPHVALAIGLAFLIVPTGLIARLIAVLFTGWTTPPQWVSSQDPFGLSLIVALVLKETPFLAWGLLSILNRQDVKQNLAQHSRIARSLGHGPRSVWNRIILPQILPRILWPVVAVLAYGMTVVDMALVIGPTQPPTLATLIWRDLNDGETSANGRGAAGVLILSAAIAAVMFMTWAGLKLAKSWRSDFYGTAPQREHKTWQFSKILWPSFRALYVIVALVLLIQSLSGHWPFPNLLANQFSLKAWQTLFTEYGPLLTSLGHASLATCVATVITVTWLESQLPRRDVFMFLAAGLSLCLPALLLGLGQYRLYLQMGLTGSHIALFFAHLIPTTAYVFIMLHGPYRDFDPRWKVAANGLRITPMKFLLTVKWPLLKSTLWSATAVGFAVAISQFVAVQLAASGRHDTLAMEAVSLTSGGNRALIATYALALMALPVIAFVLAAILGRPRWRTL